MIAIIDYGMGNLLSVKNALEYIGAKAEIVTSPEDLDNYERLILPGVGAFGDCIANLEAKHFVSALNKNVLQNKKPILGICLGMQVMSTTGYENGKSNGLSWFEAEVVKMNPYNRECKIPHVGWSETMCKDHPLFEGLPPMPEFYYVHSYYVKCKDQNDVIAAFDHGGEFTSAICKNNIIGTQFHPEKSQEYGLKVLRNFIRWNFN